MTAQGAEYPTCRRVPPPLSASTTWDLPIGAESSPFPSVGGQDDAEQNRRPVGCGGGDDMAMPDRASELQAPVHVEDDTRRIDDPAGEQEQERIPGEVFDHRLQRHHDEPAEREIDLHPELPIHLL